MPFPCASLLAVVVLAATAWAACTGPPRDDNRCGSPTFNMAACSPGQCCSQHNWCGVTPDHCNPDICASSSSLSSSSSQGPSSAFDFSPEERQAQRGAVQTTAIQGIGRRLSITAMSSSQLTAYRDVWARVMSGGQDSIYYQIAQDHGIPNFYCPHGSEKFLPWHRRYVDRMEEALGVPLAYWDWTQGGSTGRIPNAFADPTYINSQGVRVPNPLFAGVLPSGEMTSRNPRLTPSRYQAVVAFAQEQPTFSRFTRTLESVHDNVHGSVGRTMSMVSIAGFDPIFFAHHCFVDYQWWVWQLSHPDAAYGADASGPMDDSIGTFLGDTMIRDQSGWRRGRSADDLPRARASSIFTEPQLFLILKNVTSLPVSTEISVLVDDIVLAKDIRFGMQGMAHRIEKEFTMYVDPKAANIVWTEKKIPLEQIPNRAKAWLTVNGVQVRVLEGIGLELEWMQSG